MHDVEALGQRVGAGVRGAQHGALDRGSGEQGGDLERAPQGVVARPFESRRQMVREQPPGGRRQARRLGAASAGDVALDGVRDRVQTGGRRDVTRQRVGERGVENHRPEARVGRAAGHLAVGRGVGDERVRLGLAAGAGGGRHADRRQQGHRGVAEALVVGDGAAVGDDEVDPLRAVHRAAAADGDEQVRRDPTGRRHSGLDVLLGGVLVDIGEDRDLETGRFEGLERSLGVAGGFDPPVGHHQGAPPGELTRQPAELAEASRSVDDPGALDALVPRGVGLQVERRPAAAVSDHGLDHAVRPSPRVSSPAAARRQDAAATSSPGRGGLSEGAWRALRRYRKSNSDTSCGWSQAT